MKKNNPEGDKFKFWVLEKLPQLKVYLSTYKESNRISRINQTELVIWGEVPGYHESFAFVFISLLNNSERKELLDEMYFIGRKTAEMRYEKLKQVFINEIDDEVLKLVQNPFEHLSSNFKLLDIMAGDFYQFCKFGVTDSFEGLRNETDEEYFVSYIKSSKIRFVFEDILSGLYSKSKVLEITESHNGPTTYFRNAHDGRSVKQKKEDLVKIHESLKQAKEGYEPFDENV